MADLVLIDTSVLLNILDVPNRNADRASVVRTFAAGQRRRDAFVLPVTSIIETGNHIAQLPSGGQRRACAARLISALDIACVDDAPPWTLTGAAWDNALITAIIHGTEHRPNALAMFDQGIGTGDLAILAEVDVLRTRLPSATPIWIWTLDETLGAYAQSYR